MDYITGARVQKFVRSGPSGSVANVAPWSLAGLDGRLRQALIRNAPLREPNADARHVYVTT
jgi:hypothetical protein